jgi:hypothetical protein
MTDFSNETLENKIINDLGDKDILETTEFLKPKHKRVVSDKVRAERTERIVAAAKKRGDDSKIRKEKELEAKEEQMRDKLRVLEEKKNQVKALREKKGEVSTQPKAEPKAEPLPKVVKKTKKAVKVVVEQSSSDSEDYSDSDSSSSGSEVIYISKSKAKKQVKEPKTKTITKEKNEPIQQIKAPPVALFKFV